MKIVEELWHGINIDNAIKVITSGYFKPYTMHRYWLDGQNRTDKDSQYNESFWMRGWSTTRDKNYAMSKGGIVFSLNKSWIKNNYKIIPISWGSRIYKNKNIKREKEEFIIALKEKKTEEDYFLDFENKMDSYENKISYIYNSLRNNEINENVAKLRLKLVSEERNKFIEEYSDYIDYKIKNNIQIKNMFFEKAVLNIYMSKNTKEIYSNSQSGIAKINMIEKHDRFKGYYDENGIITENKASLSNRKKYKN